MRREWRRPPWRALTLGQKLMLATLAFCAAFTVLTVLLRVGISWRAEVADVDSELRMIDRIVEHPVTTALWEFDQDALQSQLDAIMQIAGVGDVELAIVREGQPTDTLRRRREGADVPTPSTPSVQRVLTHEVGLKKRQTLGTLRITADERVMWQRLRNDLSGIVIAQLIQSVLLSGLVMWLFHRSVTVHVRRVAEHLDAVRPETLDRPLALDRSREHHDELSLLVEGVNTLQVGMSDHLQRQLAAERDLAAHRDQLKEMVAAGTAELRTANAQLEQLVRSDALTGLANRRCFDEMKESETRRAVRGRQPLSVLVCDVDYFKRYNDTYGHAAGDTCLRAVADVLSKCFRRAGEVPARVGGEEFAVLLPGIGQAQALIEAERVRLVLVGKAIPHSDSLVAEVVTMSIGVAELEPSDGGVFDTVLHRADTALYRAKHAGRNRASTATAGEAEPPPAPAAQAVIGNEDVVA